MWCVPSIDAEYKERLYDLVDIYNAPYDEKLPVVCLDEKSVELRSDKRPSQRCATTAALKRDSEYLRHGTANIFVMSEPKGGLHYARVTKRRTRKDFAECVRWLAARYPDAITIHLVMDNLNTHSEKSLIKRYGPEEGRRIWARFTPHYTPKHASWLNQAEISIGVMSRCCLGKDRISDIKTLKARIAPFWKRRRQERWKINWGFTRKRAAQWIKTFGSEH